jgi:ketosteroid isomerase-like protein
MSNPNLAIVKSIYEAMHRADGAAVLAHLAPDVAIHEAESLPYGGTYRGPEGFGQLVGRLLEVFEKTDLAVDRILDAGDHIVAELRGTMQVRATGERFPVRVAEIWRLCDGKVVELRPFYWDTALVVEKCGGRRSPAS